jgi:hypothetical protein
MCDNDEDMKKSKLEFGKAETVVEFMELWSRFYENRICIPTYYSTFIDGSDKNEFATKELGMKLKEIARRGFLAIDSQITIPGEQKGYIVGYVSEKMADLLVKKLNRYSGIVAFYSDIKDFQEDVGVGLYVTYDQDEEEIKEAVIQKRMFGEPFTHVGNPDPDSFQMIREWMSKPVRNKMRADRYKYLIIVSPCHDSPPHLVFDKLLEVLRGI